MEDRKRTRKVGDILLEMEPLLLELACDHELQWGDILGLTYSYLMVHAPGAREEYDEGGHPEYYYGPKRSED